jgi:hypothetical protein
MLIVFVGELAVKGARSAGRRPRRPLTAWWTWTIGLGVGGG